MPNGDPNDPNAINQYYDRLGQLANLSKTGQFPGAQPSLQQQMQQGPPGSPPPAPPPQPTPPPGTPTLAQANTAAQQQPSGGGGIQGGIMGALNNPLIVGALSSYLNAIRTPRYAGRGSMIANAGLGFLSGYAGTEAAVTEQEKAKLEMEKQRQDISKNQKVAEAWDNIHQNKGTDADYLLVGQAQYLDKKQHREDVAQVNKVNGLLFAQNHPDALGARIGGAMMKNTDTALSIDDGEKAYQDATKDPTLAEQVTVELQQKKAELARTKASTASEEAGLPEKRAGGEIKTEEADFLKKATPEEKREYFLGRGPKGTTWVDVDEKGNIVNQTFGPSDQPPAMAPKGARGWMPISDYGSESRTELSRTKESLQWMQTKAGDIYPIDKNKGEKPKDPGDIPYKAGTIGHPLWKTYMDPNDRSQHTTIDVNTGAKPPTGWVPWSVGATSGPLAVPKAKADLVSKILHDYEQGNPKPTSSGLAGSLPLVGPMIQGAQKKWHDGARQYGLKTYGIDIDAPGESGASPTSSATPPPEATPTGTPSPAPTETATPPPAPTATASPTTGKADVMAQWRSYQARVPGARPKISDPDASGVVHHGAAAPGQPDVWFD